LKSHETKVVAMALVVIALGSNIAPEHNLPRAMRSLKDMAGRPLRVSQVYETPPIGSPGAPWFLNAAVLLETSRALPGLRMVLRRIEAQLGRIRTQDPNAPRTIVSVAARVAGVERDPAKVAAELERLARNHAPKIGGDTIVPEGPVQVLAMKDLLQYAHVVVPVAEVVPEWPFQGQPLRQWAQRFHTQARGFRTRPEIQALLARWVVS